MHSGGILRSTILTEKEQGCPAVTCFVSDNILKKVGFQSNIEVRKCYCETIGLPAEYVCPKFNKNTEGES